MDADLRIMGSEIEFAATKEKSKGQDKAYESFNGDGQAETIMYHMGPEDHYRADKEALGEVCLKNGGRLYRDVGGLVEYASSECLGALDVLIYEKAVESLLVKAGREFGDNDGERVIFQKKNVDYYGFKTRGAHENYLTTRDVFKKIVPYDQQLGHFVYNETVNFFVLFLITRQILTGSGGLVFYSPSQAAKYYISPRALFIDEVLSSSSTGGDTPYGTATSMKRAIINARDESHADVFKYRRLHLLMGDSNMSDRSIYLKYLLTSTVLEIIEEGFMDEKLQLSYLSEAPELMQKISADLTLRSVPIKLIDGREFSALEVQNLFFELCDRYLASRKKEKRREHLKETWGELLADLGGGRELASRRLDWIVKKNVIDHYREKRNLGPNHEKVVMRDFQYHFIDPKESLYYLLVRKGLIDVLAEPEQIERAASHPPANTRAKVRTEYLNRIRALNLQYFWNWTQISFYHKWPDPPVSQARADNSLKFYDPFRTDLDLSRDDNAAAEKALRRLEA